MKILLSIALFLLVVLFIVSLMGCTSYDPIGKTRNVSYTFETISYESPNSNLNPKFGTKQTVTLPHHIHLH